MKSVIFCGIVAIMLAVALRADVAVVKNLGDTTFDEFYLDYDPSSVSVSNDHQSVLSPRTYLERWRIITDLNNDGRDDVILSDTQDAFGNGGGGWLVYLCVTNGKWRCVGDVGIHPGAFTLDQVGDEVDLWYYSHVSAREGFVGYYSFTPDGMRNEVRKMFVRTENEDDEGVFTCLGRSIFGYAHNHPYVLDISETSTNGIVSWKRVGDWCKPTYKNEVYDLKQRLMNMEKRARMAEAKLQQLSNRLYEYELGVHQICGIKLGEAWDGGEKNRACEEIFSGFTNLTVSVDGDNFIEKICFTRKDSAECDEKRHEGGKFEPTDEEQKILHQVENQFNIRLGASSKVGVYSWGGPISGTWIDVRFANKDNPESHIELRYSRKFDKR